MDCRNRAPFLALLGLLLAAPAAGGAEEVRAFDKNGDGKTDKWALFDGKWPSEIRYDRNFDGLVDEWEFLNEKGRMTELREDRNFDGRVDRIVSYENGFPAFKKVDVNFDGRFDELEFYTGSEDVRTVSPELTRLLAVRAGEPVSGTEGSEIATPDAERAQAVVPASAPVGPRTEYMQTPAGVQLPMLGGLNGRAGWKMETDASRMHGPVHAGEFELQHEVTGGSLWVERRSRENDPRLSLRDELSERMESFSRALTREFLAAKQREEPFRTPFAPGMKRVYHVSSGKSPLQVSFYVLAGPSDVVYVRASCPATSAREFERLADALVFGLTPADRRGGEAPAGGS